MGMGEPLGKLWTNLIKALGILNAPWGGGIGARKITVSTSGLAPQIRRLAEEPLQFRLAVSLHGATDEVRNKIMPVNRKFPLRELMAACEYYQQKKGKMITLEYILIAVSTTMSSSPGAGETGTPPESQAESDSLQPRGRSVLGTSDGRGAGSFSGRVGKPKTHRHAAPLKKATTSPPPAASCG